jgi:peroxiredoxin
MSASTRPLAAAVIALALGAGAFLAYRSLSHHEALPEVRYTLLDGRQASTADLRGKVTLVNFWATSCTTCMHEMPAMVQTFQKYQPQGLQTLAVAMSYDPPAYVANYAESRKLPFMVAIDNTGDVAKRFGEVRLTPTTFVVNKRGEIVKRYVGEPDFKQLHALLEQLLAEQA